MNKIFSLIFGKIFLKLIEFLSSKFSISISDLISKSLILKFLFILNLKLLLELNKILFMFNPKKSSLTKLLNSSLEMFKSLVLILPKIKYSLFCFDAINSGISIFFYLKLNLYH